MVAVDFALRSFAVLSTVGFGIVRGEGRYARYRQWVQNRDEGGVSLGTLESGGTVTSLPVVTSTPTPPAIGPPVGPPQHPTEAGSASTSTIPLDLGNTATSQEGTGAPSADAGSSSSLSPGQDGASSSTTSTMSYNTLQTLSGSVTDIPTVPPTVIPPVRPGGQTTASAVTVSLDIGDPASNTLLSQVSGSLYNTLITVTNKVTSTPTVPPTMRPPTIPGRPLGAASDITASALDLGQGQATSDAAGLDPSLDTLQTLTNSVTSTPTVPPTVRPPVRPGSPSSVVSDVTGSALDLGHGGGTSTDVVSGSGVSTSTVGEEATYLNSDSSSSATSYIDPGLYGAGGTLTTDSNSFSRTVEPTRSSILPDPSSGIAPPPADTAYVPTTSRNKSPSLPTLAKSVAGVSVNATSTAGDDLSYAAGQTGVGPSSKPASTTTSVIMPTHPTAGGPGGSSSLFSTLDMGYTDTPPASGATTTSSASSSAATGWGNSTSTGNTSLITTASTIPLSQWSYSVNQTTTTDSRGSTGTVCGPTDALKPVTTYSIVYTYTITWYGNPASYTPPYPPISTPAPCIPPSSPLRLTMSYCMPTALIVGGGGGGSSSSSSSGSGRAANPPQCMTSTLSLAYTTALPGATAADTITFLTTDKNPAVVFSTIQTPNYGVDPTRTQVDVHSSAVATTDPLGTPSQLSGKSGLGGSGGGSGGSSSAGGGSGTGSGSGGSGNAGSSGSGNSGAGSGGGSGSSSSGSGNSNGSGDSGTSNGSGSSGTGRSSGNSGSGDSSSGSSGGGSTGTSSGGDSSGGGSGSSGGSGSGSGSGDAGSGTDSGTTADEPSDAAAESPITVAVQPSAVVLDGQTISDDPAEPTQTVTVGDQPVTIDPSQVVVAGQTVTRAAETGAVYVPTPTSTQIQGVPVTVSSSVAVIGGTSFTLGFTPTTTVVDGKPVTVGPSGVVVASTTIPVVAVPAPTHVVVEGGELVTAIGPSVVVIHGTTITYGPDEPASTTVVDDDTITIGPSGVVVDGTTIGGPMAGQSATQYEIVGGATITQMGPSVVVINNATYTVGPGAGTTTTVVGGETVTIGPSGVAAGTHTLSYPFGANTTTTITPQATGVLATASPTASASASKDAGPALRPDPWAVASFVCIAIGVVGYAV